MKLQTDVRTLELSFTESAEIFKLTDAWAILHSPFLGYLFPVAYNPPSILLDSFPDSQLEYTG